MCEGREEYVRGREECDRKECAREKGGVCEGKGT